MKQLTVSGLIGGPAGRNSSAPPPAVLTKPFASPIPEMNPAMQEATFPARAQMASLRGHDIGVGERLHRLDLR